jgi:hypothetical protein
MPVIVLILDEQPIVFHLPATAEPGPHPATIILLHSLPHSVQAFQNIIQFLLLCMRRLYTPQLEEVQKQNVDHFALSLVNSSPLRSPTSVKLLQFRRLDSGKLGSRVCETLGDDITTCIAGEDLPERVTCNRLTTPKAAAPNTGKDAPYFQFL